MINSHATQLTLNVFPGFRWRAFHLNANLSLKWRLRVCSSLTRYKSFSCIFSRYWMILVFTFCMGHLSVVSEWHTFRISSWCMEAAKINPWEKSRLVICNDIMTLTEVTTFIAMIFTKIWKWIMSYVRSLGPWIVKYSEP